MKVTLPTSFPRCKICKRAIKNSKSVAKGVGPECAQKFEAMLVGTGLTLQALNIPESIAADRTVGRYLHLAVQALLVDNLRDVERFKIAAKEAAQRAERAQLAEAAWNEEGQYEYGRFVQAA
jgi:hypothetical protein